MWKPNKDDSLFLISSVFVGIKNNESKYYLDFRNIENNLISFNYMTETESNIEIGIVNNIRCYPEHKVVNIKDLLYSIKCFEEEYNCEVYYFPYSKKEGETIFDIKNKIDIAVKEKFHKE